MSNWNTEKYAFREFTATDVCHFTTAFLYYFIIICWFAQESLVIIIYVENSCAASYILSFMNRKLKIIYFKIEIFCNITNAITPFWSI